MTDNTEQNNANNTMPDGITDVRNVGKSAVVQQNLLLSAGVSKTDVSNSSKTLTVVTATNNNQVPINLTQSNLNTPKSTLTNSYGIEEYLNDVIKKCDLTLQEFFKADNIEVSESVKDEQIGISKALVLSKDRNFFNLTFDNNYINNVPGTFVKTNNCRNYWSKMFAKRHESEEVSYMWKTALEKHPINTNVTNPEPNRDAYCVFYILKSAAENNVTPPPLSEEIDKLSDAMKKFLEHIVKSAKILTKKVRFSSL